MLDEYQRELVNEILSEVLKMKDFFEIRDLASYQSCEDRIKVIAKILKGQE